MKNILPSIWKMGEKGGGSDVSPTVANIYYNCSCLLFNGSVAKALLTPI